MFTGLITDVGTIVDVEAKSDGLRRFRIACAYDMERVALGASIACGGPCLTVVAKGADSFDVEAASETLARTNAGEWKTGTRLNLERSLALGDELGGHLVTGHIDGLADVLDREDHDGTARFVLEAPRPLARFVAEKGSVSLDGTSLTVNGVEGARFTVLLIPHSLRVTTWGERRIGDRVNLEVDLLARYVARLHDAPV